MRILRWTSSHSAQEDDDPVVFQEDEESGCLGVKACSIPLIILCHPQEQRGRMKVKINLHVIRSDLLLHNIKIAVPLGTSDPPDVKDLDGGLYKHDPDLGLLCWYFDALDAKKNTYTI